VVTSANWESEGLVHETLLDRKETNEIERRRLARITAPSLQRKKKGREDLTPMGQGIRMDFRELPSCKKEISPGNHCFRDCQ